MHSLNNTDHVPGGTALLALSLIATFSLYYLYNDKRFTLSERLYYLICKRNIREALLEHELLALRKDPPRRVKLVSNAYLI